jgi:hypothetical protein
MHLSFNILIDIPPLELRYDYEISKTTMYFGINLKLTPPQILNYITSSQILYFMLYQKYRYCV